PATLFLTGFYIYCFPTLHALHSFPTRRSSDLLSRARSSNPELPRAFPEMHRLRAGRAADDTKRRKWSARIRLTHHYESQPIANVDRKSTRLNSSHLGISYAVFCLKKKKYNTKI